MMSKKLSVEKYSNFAFVWQIIFIFNTYLVRNHFQNEAFKNLHIG